MAMYRKTIVVVDRGGWTQYACTYQLMNGYAREPRPRVKALDGLIDWRQASRVCVEAGDCDVCPPWGD
jgi:hypothetical protein